LTKGTARYTCWVRPPRVVYVGRDLAVSCVRYWPGDGAVGGWAKNEYFPPLRVRKYSFFARHIPPHPRLEGGCARKSRLRCCNNCSFSPPPVLVHVLYYV
jgi:hypothetical protein